MTETTKINKTKLMMLRFATALTSEIMINYDAEEMAGCSHALTPLLQARVFGPLPNHVEHVIELIKTDILTIPHFACSGCGAVFADDQDLETDITPERDPHEDPELPIEGACPVCESAVYLKQPAK